MRLFVLLPLLFVSIGAERTPKPPLPINVDPRPRPAGNPDARIIGGTNAPFGRYPYIAALTYFGSISCGGSLIAPDIVLSAAHCEAGVTAAEIGQFNRNNPNDGVENFDIIQKVSHPSYNDNTYTFDMMILKLSGSSTKPLLSLNTDAAVPNLDQLTVMGFGTTISGVSSSVSSQLLETTVTHVPNDVCEDSKTTTAAYENLITDDMLCAAEPGHDSCQGDSGGPLILRGSGFAQDVQVGVVSWGFGCALPAFPGIYSRVSYEYEWIRSVVCDISGAPPASFQCGGGPSWTVAPTPSPPSGGGGGSLPLTIQIQMDDRPQDIGWQIDRIGLQQTTVAQVIPGVYVNPNEAVFRTVYLEERAQYYFRLYDVNENGITNGMVQLFLGTTEPSTSSGGILILNEDGNFGDNIEFTFVASLDSVDPVNPGLSSGDAFATLELRMDEYPEEIGVQVRSPTSGVVFFRPAQHYDSETYALQDVTEVIQLQSGEEYEFVIADSYGDGLCCGYNGGRTDTGYTLYLGDSDPANVIIDSTFEGLANETTTFETPAGTPVNPPGSTSQITVRIQLDDYPQENGFLLQTLDGDVVAQRAIGFYSGQNFQLVEETFAVPEGLYALTIFDSYGDGLFSPGFYEVVYQDSQNRPPLIRGLFRVPTGEREYDTTNIFAVEGSSATFPVEISVATDNNPELIQVVVYRLDIQEASVPVAYSRVFTAPFATEVLNLMLESGGLYQVLVVDASEDGLAGGVTVTVGSNSIQMDTSSPALYFTRNFVARSTLPFTNPGATTGGITLNLRMKFDNYPSEIDWMLLADTSVSASRVLVTDEVVAFGPPSYYTDDFIATTVNEPIHIPQFSGTKRFTLIVKDLAGDGLCCDFGNGGPIELYNGDVLLATDPFVNTPIFVANFELTGSLAPPPSPTSPPTSGASGGTLFRSLLLVCGCVVAFMF